MSRRLKRINKLLKQEVGKILQKEIHQGLYLITLTDVNTAPDLKKAHIKISVLPENKEKEVLDNLKNNITHIQRLINKKLNIKFVPRINFIIDKGEKSARTVDIILGKLSS